MLDNARHIKNVWSEIFCVSEVNITELLVSSENYTPSMRNGSREMKAL